jgi:hypothetical protein
MLATIVWAVINKIIIAFIVILYPASVAQVWLATLNLERVLPTFLGL